MKKLLIAVQAVLAAPVDSAGSGPTGSQANAMGGDDPGWSTISKGGGGSNPARGP